ncbi:MAG: tetratricopeptide repeat protein, partial [Planctomycetes bacterium]|nr:tetratricopeptide repeat protein [Planctomycetota bacterium]
LIAQGGVASVLRRRKRYAEAEEMYKSLIEKCSRVLGETHVLTATYKTKCDDMIAEKHTTERADPEF